MKYPKVKMCLVVVINVRDWYKFPHSKDIPSLAAICAPNNSTAAILDVFHNDLTVHAIGQKKAIRSACYNAGAIFDSF